MNVGLTTSHNRMAPCFPGAELWILGPDQQIGQHQVVPTVGWHPLAWGQELMRWDVSMLLCAGIDQFLWGALQGYGIQVIPNAMGDPNEVFSQWRAGRLAVPPMWPMYPGMYGRGRGRGRGRRFRGGRG